MAYSFVMLLLFGAYMGWFYWNRAKKIREAGGAEQFGQQLQRRQFGLAPDESVKHYFFGEMYLGPLRPDVGPSTTAKVVGAAFGTSYRGAMTAFALTDRDRCAIAIEPGDHTSMRDRLDAMKGEHLGLDPYVIFGNSPKPRVRRGEEVFGGHPQYPKDGPKRASMSGSMERCVLIHIEPVQSNPYTLWIDPLGAKALVAWSQLRSDAGYAHPQAHA